MGSVSALTPPSATEEPIFFNVSHIMVTYFGPVDNSAYLENVAASSGSWSGIFWYIRRRGHLYHRSSSCFYVSKMLITVIDAFTPTFTSSESSFRADSHEYLTVRSFLLALLQIISPNLHWQNFLFTTPRKFMQHLQLKSVPRPRQP